jgi:hypothetical protein
MFVDVQVPVASTVPAGIGLHVPTFPVTRQLAHNGPQLLVSQQTPSGALQCPLEHWSSVMQATPPAWRGTQLPPSPVQ